MIRKHYLFFTMLAVCLGQLTVSTHAIAQDAVGRVIIVSGKLTAVKADGTQKKLRRKSKIFPGDTLQTGDKSKAQIRFIDGAIVSLTSSSELLVSEYAYDIDAPENNKSIMTLVTGGIRTITGAIGKEDQTDYKLNTPVATIGIRGTIYEVQQTETLAVAVWQGAITVSNDGGDIELGSGGDFNYARVESAYAAPKGLLSLPKEIAKKNDVPVEVEEDAKESSEEESDEQSDEESDEQSEEKQKSETDEKEQSEKTAESDKESTTNNKDQSASETESTDEDSRQTDSQENNEERNQPKGDSDSVEANQEGEPQLQQKQENEQNSNSTEESGSDNTLEKSGPTDSAPEQNSAIDSNTDSTTPSAEKIEQIKTQLINEAKDQARTILMESLNIDLDAENSSETVEVATPVIDNSNDPVENELTETAPPEVDESTEKETFVPTPVLSDADLTALSKDALIVVLSSTSPQLIRALTNSQNSNRFFAIEDGTSNSSEITQVLKKGQAKLSVFNANAHIDWGAWNTQSGSLPWQRFDDPTDNTKVTTIGNSTLWLTADKQSPDLSAEIWQAENTFWFGTTTAIRGVTTNSDQVLSGQLIGRLNFGTSEIELSSMNIVIATADPLDSNSSTTEEWKINLVGVIVNNNEINAQATGGTINEAAVDITGQLDAFLFGDTGTDMLGGFLFSNEEASVAGTINSAFCDSDCDQRLSKDQLSLLDEGRLSLVVISGTSAEAGLHTGLDVRSKIGNDSTSLQVSPDHYGNSLPAYTLDVNNATIGQAGQLVESQSNSSEIDAANYINWGAWDTEAGPIALRQNPQDKNDYTAINDDAYFIAINPTATDVIANRTGTVTYNKVGGYAGGGSHGELTSLSFTADINFDTSAINNGALGVTLSDQSDTQEIWNATFDGNINGNMLDLNVTGGAVNSRDAITGDIGGAFTGSTGQGIGGFFDLENAADNTQSAEGVFFTHCTGNEGC